VNADEVREELAATGHAFTSDGDTEVIAHDPRATSSKRTSCGRSNTR